MVDLPCGIFHGYKDVGRVDRIFVGKLSDMEYKRQVVLSHFPTNYVKLEYLNDNISELYSQYEKALVKLKPKLFHDSFPKEDRR